MRIRLPRITDAKDYIITALVLIFATGLMISRHDGGLQNIRKVSVAALSYLEQPLSTVRVYRQALNTNTYLQRQAVLLQDELSRLRAAEAENEIYRALLGFRQNSNNPMVPVRVVAKELFTMNNTLTVSAGSDDGVRKNMPVVNADGLFGQVLITTKKFSQIMPFANSLFNVSARVQGSRAHGIITWEGRRYDELLLRYIPQTIDIQPGQTVETYGSDQFPPGIPIGEVIRVVPEEGVETQLVYVRPYVNLNTVAEGFVLLFEPEEEILDLQQQIEQQEEQY